MPTITSMPFLSIATHENLIIDSDLGSMALQHLVHMQPENILSGLVLIALLTYFYTAFSKIFQPGGLQDGDKQIYSKVGSRIYYSSPAAV